MVQGEAAERFLAAPLLADVDPELRRVVLDRLEENRLPAGAVLLEQGQPTDYLSFLIGGSATIERALPDGRKEALATLHAPAIFGTTSFFRPNKPTFSVRATTDVWFLTLDHPAHERLRHEDPKAAEALALATLRVLAERFDLLDRRISEYLVQHSDDRPKVTEWAGFRARFFEDSNI
ncbi:MAG: cyclic nucleotide-binding domain-containing protein [Planctomycetaceae bacterium]